MTASTTFLILDGNRSTSVVTGWYIKILNVSNGISYLSFTSSMLGSVSEYIISKSGDPKTKTDSSFSPNCKIRFFASSFATKWK